MPRAIATTDHRTIRQWIEARNGHPAVVRATESDTAGKAGLLRIDFNKPEDALDEVSWDRFFETFDENQLAFLYQEKTASGRKSRFNKFVSRDSVDTQATGDASSMHATEGDGSTPRRASQSEAEEIDEEDALEEDKDLQDDEKER